MIRRSAKPIVVSVVGQVDQGKTTLLDSIRGTKLVEIESGRITQNIRASSFCFRQTQMILVDTPGHEALGLMRDFGTSFADVIILVIGVDAFLTSQSVLPSNKMLVELSNKKVIVGLNKIDKFPNKINEIRDKLKRLGIESKTAKGNDRFIFFSAVEGTGINQLLETVRREGDKRDALINVPAQGIILDSSVSKKGGTTATILIQMGTLEVGAAIIYGTSHTKVRALINENGLATKSAGPFNIVTICGLSFPPKRGARFITVKNEKRAKEILGSCHYSRITNNQVGNCSPDVRDLFRPGKHHLGCFILRAKTFNMVEVLSQLLEGAKKKYDVELKIISRGLGNVSCGDIKLATITKARIISFGLAEEPKMAKLLKQHQISCKNYNLIFDLTTDIERELGIVRHQKHNQEGSSKAQIKRLFVRSGRGIILGCLVTEGNLRVGQLVRIVRGNKELSSNCKIGALKRFKEDVREAKRGEECGVSLSLNQEVEVEVGDFITAAGIRSG
ncbi:translation initiation factor IF-2 [Candidatus Tremblaya phenacola PAVE]|nr:translation initiation factor IF-2 [Candidatus Tremblaya phenacola PAVE]